MYVNVQIYFFFLTLRRQPHRYYHQIRLFQALTTIFVCAGRTYGSWDGTDLAPQDMAAIKLDAEGNELWRYQVGWFVSLVQPDCCERLAQ